MKKVFILSLISLTFVLYSLTFISTADAHRSGCHRWHSCPSDTGSYSCGDAGHPCQYPTYPKAGGVIYPSSGYYKDCYNCPLKKVPVNDTRIFKNTLSKGTYSADVVALQKILNREGVYDQAIYSGYYGTLTEEAVKRFQKKYSIVNSGSPSTTGHGSVGWATLSKLNELYKYRQ